MDQLSRGPARIAEELRRLGVSCEVKEMPQSTRTAQEAAAAVGCDVAQIVKSLIFRSVVGDQAVLVLVSGADRVDEDRLAEVIGEQVERATADFVRTRTGYAIGGVPPLGHIQPVVTLVDRHLLDADTRVGSRRHSPRRVFHRACRSTADHSRRSGERRRLRCPPSQMGDASSFLAPYGPVAHTGLHGRVPS